MAEDSLHRFIEAQNTHGAYARALDELRAGAKASHWMWFIFPQIAGLGHSPTAQFYAIGNMDEARRYLAHPVLGPRLAECAKALLGWAGRAGAEQILGPTDAMKLRSSMTLFHAAGGDRMFGEVLNHFFDGQKDERTLAILAQ